MKKRSEDPAERLRRSSGKYRRSRSALNFFRVWGNRSVPAVVCGVTIVFLSKLLWPPLIWGLYCLPVWLFFTAIYVSMRPQLWRISCTYADAVIDWHSGKRGLYMAVQESHNKEWQRNLSASVHQPPMRIPWKAVIKCLVGIVLLTAVAQLPDLRSEPPSRKGPATPLERTAQMIEVLKSENLAEKEELEKVEKLVERLQKDGKKDIDRDEWRALDQSREDLRREVAKALSEKSKRRNTLKSAVKKLQEQGQISPKNRRELADALKKLPEAKLQHALKGTSEKTGLSQKALNEVLQKSGQKAGGLSQTEKKALAEMACQAGMCKKGSGQSEKKALLKAGFSKKEVKAMMSQSRPGKGGVTRGPGSAPVRHVGDTEKGKSTFKAETFKGQMSELTANLGSSTGAPDAESEVETGSADPELKRDFRKGSEGLTWHTRTLPRHNEALKRYFDNRD